tara:strand:+ start:32028 stop:33317 length:1290 start_codon:yes stop_codon:yes gene_type:complete
MSPLRHFTLFAITSSLAVTSAFAQTETKDQTTDERLDKLEAENQELRQQIGAVADGLETFELRDVIPQLGESHTGLGPAASKVYNLQSTGSVSIGGYGEFLYQDRQGGRDTFDAQRGVLYFGSKLSDKWILNTEFEFEHGSTSASSGSTPSGGSASLEFGYLDYMHSQGLNGRAGLLLVPMGFINERHEPTTYLAATRPQTESRIIPSTWRELGIGIHGQSDAMSYRLYTVNGLNGSQFDASGLRSGRQKGNRAAADDMAVTGRMDFDIGSGVTIGGAFFHGNSSNGQEAMLGGSNLETLIFEVHAEVQSGPWHGRFLAAQADVDGVAAFNTATGENLAERLEGSYVELGYDVLAGTDSGMSLSPYVRYERIDTQASLPAGFAAMTGQDIDITTVGLNFKPTPQVVIKLDYDDFNVGSDRWNLLIGYIF